MGVTGMDNMCILILVMSTF